MKTLKIVLIVVIISFQSTLHCFSQIVFTKGYVINNKNEKITCLIKNNDWLENPIKIQYKLNENSSIITAEIDSIKEFGIDNFSKYVRAAVQIDRSPSKIALLNDKKQPEWSEETLFLRELVSGKIELLEYVGTDRSWYFYSIDNSVPEQLIFKEYKSQDKILENASYRQQLFAYLQNDRTKKVEVATMKYDKNSFIEYFRLYNNEVSSKSNSNKPDREIFNAKVSGSLEYVSFNIGNSLLDSKPFEFGSKINWMAGLELEYFLPFNRNTFSLILSPTYEQINYNKTRNVYAGDIFLYSETRILELQSITFPLGIRYSAYQKNDARLFFDLSFNSPLNINLKKYFNYFNSPTEISPSEGANFIFGAGYASKNIELQLKYHTSRSFFNGYGVWYNNYPKLSFTASYKLYKIIGK
jgi:hypothetical protein